MTEPSFYAVIPANVRYDSRLSSTAKLIYGEISALANKEGFCWAANSYFSEVYGITESQASVVINSLKKAGYIRIEIDKVNGNKRTIYLNLKKTYPGKSILPSPEKPKENTTSIINITRDILTNIINHYIKAKNWEQTIENNKKLLSDIYKRNGKAAKDLFSLAGESTEEVYEAIDFVARRSQEQGGWDWTLTTVCKKFPEFKTAREEQPEGAAGREL